MKLIPQDQSNHKVTIVTGALSYVPSIHAIASNNHIASGKMKVHCSHTQCNFIAPQNAWPFHNAAMN